MSTNHKSNNKEPTRVQKKKPKGYLNKALVIAPLLSSIMLTFGLINLIGAESLIDWAKIIVIGLASFVVSYTVYRLAIEKGAPLTARGIASAGVISVLSITIIALGMWLATIFGLIGNGVEERRLQAYAAEKVIYLQEQSAIATAAVQLVPVVSSNAADLSEKAACEIASSCVSGRGTGGYGDVARLLDVLSSRADSIADEALAGLAARDALLEELTTLMRDMEVTLADESTSIWERRAALRQIDAQIGQVLARLEGAVPVSLFDAYSDELRAGINLPGDAATTATINGYLTGYANSLDVVLDNLDAQDVTNPTFPERSGAWETLSYLGQYAPIALLTFAVEFVFPLALWAFTLQTLNWDRFRHDPDGDQQEDDPSVFDQLTSRPIEPAPPTLVRSQPEPVRRVRSRRTRRP